MVAGKVEGDGRMLIIFSVSLRAFSVILRATAHLPDPEILIPRHWHKLFLHL